MSKLTDKLLGEDDSNVQSKKIPAKYMASVIYPEGKRVTNGTHPILGEWGEHTVPTANLVSVDPTWSRSGSLEAATIRYTQEKAAAVAEFVQSVRGGEANTVKDSISGVAAKAEALWAEQGPFMTKEVSSLQQASVRVAVTKELQRLGFSQRTLPLFKPLVLWFKR